MRFVLPLLYLLLCTAPLSAADLRIHPGGAFQVLGDPSDEWRFQFSTNLSDWTDAPELGTMFSDSAVRALKASDSEMSFFRAVRTEGLFDERVIRTFHLTFATTDWRELLQIGHGNGSNTLCDLVLDNGLTNLDVGARYKGFSSFQNPLPKKSINLEISFVHPEAELMNQITINLNNAFGDRTVMREPIYFNIKREFVPSPRGAIARLYINNEYWGVYTLAQQENRVLIDEWFPSTQGDRWRTPNAARIGESDMSYISSELTPYYRQYDLRTDNSTNAWERLTNAIYVLADTPRELRRDRYEDVYAVDRWLWSFALENVFGDQDSYVFKGADYSFYYEPESGRIHPIEHDGSEAFYEGFVNFSPVMAASDGNRMPAMFIRMLAINELRQRYLAHMRTMLEERFNPQYLNPVIDRLHRLSAEHVAADPKKNYTMSNYNNSLIALRTFITNRHQTLTNHAEVRARPPTIQSVNGPAESPGASDKPTVTAKVSGGTNGVESVWLYWRTQGFGRFNWVQMFDDGAHADGPAGDSAYGASLSNYPPGTVVRYYIEARSGNTNRTAVFSPARAEQVTYSYRVRLEEAFDSPVVINEFMAENTKTLADPQGEYDDWIELHNRSDQEVDLGGWYLSDKVDNPRKFRFPAGTRIEARGYLLVWADEDGSAASGLHANFKLSNDGEEILLVDSDERQNRLLDHVSYGKQGADYSHGRDGSAPSLFKDMTPTPGEANR